MSESPRLETQSYNAFWYINHSLLYTKYPAHYDTKDQIQRFLLICRFRAYKGRC